MDQTAVTAAAQRNLALQAGRAVPETDMPVQLSAEAVNRRDLMINMFKELPDDLPGWELLLAMPFTECMSFINSKIDRALVDTGETMEVDRFRKATTPVVYSIEQIDDRITNLHTASFLRAPLSEPLVYYPLMEKKRSNITTFIPEGAIGFDCGISDLAIKKMSDRTVPLSLKHLLKSNCMVEKRAPISKRRAVQGLGIGEYCESTYVSDYDFKPPEFPWEILESLLAAAAVNQQIWPLDFSILNLIRALVKIQLFHNPRISMKLQVLMCTSFVDTVFIQNSKKSRADMPPLSVKECEELAKVTWGKLKMKDVEWTLTASLAASSGPLLPGQDLTAFANFELSNLGISRRKQQQMLRLQAPAYGGGRALLPAYNGGGGGGRNRGNQRNGGGNGGKRSSSSKPAAAGSAATGSAIQVCPAFSRGQPCPRGGDSRASCTTSSGVKLHHLCAICGFNTHGTNKHT